MCTKCGISKTSDQYHGVKKKSTVCKECCKSYNATRLKKYYADPTTFIKNSKKRVEKLRHINRVNLLEYFKENPCKVCGECDPRVLQFDHREQKDKLFNIAEKMNKYGWNKLKKEIDKCDVLCANHHAIRTSLQLNWWYQDYLNIAG